ncbi:hypothetical protein I8J29_16305 [Paenibacillus sp. MWE-103]|uniref:DUF3854 domain-containing protein n=1 Tax=Paenibacillus artemisiicola TaxID=1172618 RepID=A0ABS3WBR5_9BACL|nr:hypothetical protein [Paenibacillus artemisiicola]MBO7745771.1 hypothetical protein [Paenibacillus artemisiicola]
MKLRRIKHEGWYELQSPCPICGHKGWCRINLEQTVVYCMRVPSDDYFDSIIGRQFRHVLDSNAVPKIKVEINVNKAVDKKPDHHLNRVYRALLKELSLSPEHYSHLIHDRLLEEKVIQLREYRTMPVQERYKIAKNVISRLSDNSDLLGVPGFFCQEGQYGPYWTMAGGMGLMIPFRTISNEITGWQIRVDNPPLELDIKGAMTGEILEELPRDQSGKRRAKCSIMVQDKPLTVELTEKNKKEISSASGQFVFSVELKQGQRYWWWSSGSKDNGASIGGPLPVHLALPSPCLKYWNVGDTADTIVDCSEVWVTEGALKADKAADGLIKPVFGIPGAGAFSLLLEPLKALGCKHIIFAYDADVVTTKEVEMALGQCVEYFAKETEMQLSLAMWDISLGKGIDDLLDHGYLPQVSTLLR